MRGKKPTIARTWQVMACVLLTSPLLWAQTEAQIWDISQHNNSVQLKSLLVEFENEHLVTQNKMQRVSNKPDALLALSGAQLYTYGTDGTPLYYTTMGINLSEYIDNPNAKSLYTAAADIQNLHGQSMRIGIWDGGIARYSHQEFDDRVFILGEENEINNHATLVTGTLIASGVKNKAKGIISSAEALSYDWTRDKIEVVNETENGLLVSNHSYGMQTTTVPDWYFGSYIKLSRDWDRIMYNAPHYLMVAAAGNARELGHNAQPNYGDSDTGYDLLLGFTTSKNGLVVGAADLSTQADGTLINAIVTNYSSFGPTDDGRIKPDLVGDGSSVLTTSSSSDSSYNNSFGTSMSAPGVAGSVLLMQQYHQKLKGHYMKAATVKGLTLHTASDVNDPGPDYQMGWGVINVNKAFETLQLEGYSTLIIEDVLVNNGKISFNVIAKPGSHLSASISWTDPAAEAIPNGSLNERTKALIHDLNIEIKQGDDVYLPWVLNPIEPHKAATTGINQVDPFERINIPNAGGEYTVTVSHSGSLSTETQAVSIIVSGIQLSNCNLTIPSGLQLSSVTNMGVNLTWQDEMDTLYQIELINLDQDKTEYFESRIGQLQLNNLESKTRYSVRLRSECSENLKSAFSAGLEFIFDGENTTIINSQNPTNNQSQLSVYPNPTQNYLNFGDENFEGWDYSVHSSSGALQLSGEVTNRIDVSRLSAGFYVLTVWQGDSMYTTKFLKTD